MFNLQTTMMDFFWILVLLCLYKDSVLSIDIDPKLPEKVFYLLEDIDALFNEFVVKYDKKYTPAESELRRKVFGDNLIKINRWNQEQPDAVFDINPFTDLTFEEFVDTYTGLPGNFSNDNIVKYEPTGKTPETLDWRKSNLVTDVKNQGHCGSCYIFSAIGNIEGQHAKKHGKLISLSEQQSLDCNSKGCKGGLPHLVMQGLVKSGCMKESDYPYKAKQGKCRTDASKIVVRVMSGHHLSVASEEDLKNAVANYGPLSVGMFVNEQFSRHHRGIFKPTTACNKNGHAVLLIGYGTEGGVPYWLIKNSWGKHWNEKGYMRIIRGKNACRFGFYVASATVA